MFNKIITGKKPPKYLSSDNDPLFLFHRWRANLRILNVDEIKSVPYTPTSHPFVERLIGSIKSELLDQTLFWSKHDLHNKLDEYQQYYNAYRCHFGIDGNVPMDKSAEKSQKVVSLDDFRWEKHCRSLFQTPIAA